MRTRIARGMAVSAVAVLVVVPVLAGCGGSSSGSPAAKGSDSSPSTAGSTSTPPGGGTPSTSPPSSSAPSPAATEVNPPGDIPDNQAFVKYRPAGATFTVKVPEGWARSSSGGAVTFTDKLNSITVESTAAAKPTVASVKQNELPKVEQLGGNYRPRTVTVVQRKAGPAVLATYLQDSKPDPVTDKVVRDAVERYSFWNNGTEAVLTLSGPKGADNVDPWRIVSDSVTWH
jgi:hypothetical protein